MALLSKTKPPEMPKGLNRMLEVGQNDNANAPIKITREERAWRALPSLFFSAPLPFSSRFGHLNGGLARFRGGGGNGGRGGRRENDGGGAVTAALKSPKGMTRL